MAECYDSVALGETHFPAWCKFAMNTVSLKENKGERLGKGFVSHSSVSLPLPACSSPCWCSLPPPACLCSPGFLSGLLVHPASPPPAPLLPLGGTPWWLEGAWPIMYREWRGGENGCFLSTPYSRPAIPWLTIALLPINITLMCKQTHVSTVGTIKARWKFWSETSIFPTLI